MTMHGDHHDQDMVHNPTWQVRPRYYSGFKRTDYGAYAQNARTLTAMRAAASHIACHVGL